MNWIYDAEQVSKKASSLNCANVIQFANRVRTTTLGECQDILNHTTIAIVRSTPYLTYEIINLAERPHVYFRK
jgi:hypothetical protein